MSKINHLNEQLKKEFEEALLHGRNLNEKTVAKYWKSLNLYEEYTDKMDFTKFRKELAIGFKKWLSQKINQKNQPYSLSFKRSTYHHLRKFFKWVGQHPKYSRKFNAQAVMYLHLSENEQRASCASRTKPFPTIKEVHEVLMGMPSETDIEKRDRAIIAFTALIFPRNGALISLKVKDIDLRNKCVWQNPNHVKTKFGKSIETAFMPFDPLWEEIVTDWVRHLTENLGFTGEDPLFPKCMIKNNPKNLCFENFGLSREHWANTNAVRKIFEDAFNNVGLPYHNPHSFRDMITQHIQEFCNQKELKAISQNLGHEKVITTSNYYSKLSFADQKKTIENMGKGKAELSNVSSTDLLDELKRRQCV